MNSVIPLVSVVMSVYNDSKYLSESIKSILDQTLKDFEFIIVDDGSLDNSFDLLRRFKKKDNRIKILKNNSNMGLAFSLNKAIKESKGKYIARMDADDLSMPDRLKKQIIFFQKYKETDVLGTGAILIDSNSKEISKKIMFDSQEKMRKNLYLNSCFFHPSVMAKREFFLPNNLYNEELKRAQDWYLWADNIDNFTYRNIQEYLIFYRINSSSTQNIYWNLKVLILQGCKRKELASIIGVVVILLQRFKAFFVK